MTEPLKGPPPAPPAPNPAAGQTLSWLAGEFQQRWQGGERVSVEAYLREGGQRTAKPDVVLDLIHAEVLQREARGEAPQLDEYLKRFPQLAAELREQFELHGSNALPATVTAVAGSDDTQGVVAWPPSIDGYEFLGVLGKGGMGVVYRARQTKLNRVVALKVIHSTAAADPDAIKRFRTEAEAVARLQHPNIVQIYEVGESHGRPYCVLEFAEGGSLDRSLGGVPQAAATAAGLVELLARAVHAAHAKGVVHRDLKPANVLLTAEGAPKVADFGLAKLMTGGSGQTRTGDIMGTPSYMAPEQAGGLAKAVGPAADVYALGAIFYETLTGRPPFRGATPLDTVLQVVSDEPVPPRALQPKVPLDAETICLKCLEKRPNKRYATAEELADELARLVRGEPILARPVNRAARLGRWCLRNPKLASASGLAVVALLAAVVLSIGLAVTSSQGETKYRREFNKAEENRKLAEKRGDDLAKEQKKTKAALLDSNRTNAILSAEVARQFSDRGDVGGAMHQLARGLKFAPADDEPLQQMLRSNLAAWRSQLCPLKTLLQYPAEVAVVRSPDYRYLAALSGKKIDLIDVASGHTLVGPLHERNDVLVESFAPDGQSLLTFSGDGVGRFWEIPSGRLLGPLSEPVGGSSLVFFSPNGQFLVTGKLDGEMRLWDVAKRTPIGAPFKHVRGLYPGSVPGVAFSPDSKSFVTTVRSAVARFTCEAEMWDSATGRSLGTFGTNENIAAVFSPDGTTILTTTRTGFVHLHDAATRRPAEKWRELLKGAIPRGVSADGRFLLATFSGVHEWQFFDTETGKALGPRITSSEGPIPADDGKTVLIASEEGARLHETTTLKPLGPVITGSNWFAVGNPSELLLWKRDATSLRLWNPRTGEPLGPSLALHVFTDAPGTNRTVASPYLILGRDGHTLVAVSNNRDQARSYPVKGEIRVWDLAAVRTPPVTVPLANSGTRLAFRPDGRSFVTNDAAGNLELWDAAGKQLGKAEQPFAANFLDYHADGRIVLALGDGSVRLLDGADGRMIDPPPYAPGQVVVATFNRACSALLVGTSDGRARAWDTATGKPLGPVWKQQGQDGAIAAVAWASDSRLAAVATADKVVRLWDPVAGTAVGEGLVHPAAVTSIVFAPDGKSLVTTCADNKVRFWQADSGKSLDRTLEPNPGVQSALAVAFSPDGKYLLTAPGGAEAQLWDAATGKLERHMGHGIRLLPSAAFHPDGKSYLVGGTWTSGVITMMTPQPRGMVQFFETDTGKTIGNGIDIMLPLKNVVYGPDGESVFAVQNLGKGTGVLKLQPNSPSRVILPHAASVVALAAHPDGKTLLTATSDGGVSRWDAASGTAADRPHLYQVANVNLDISPDGTHMVTGGIDKVGRFWDTATGRLLDPPMEHDSAIRVVVISPDGKMIVTGTESGKWQRWDASGHPLGEPIVHGKTAVRTIRISPDSRTVLTAGQGDVRLWDAATGQPRGELKQPAKAVVAGAQFNPDGTVVLTKTSGGLLSFWETATGKPIEVPFQGQTHECLAHFGKDGTTVVGSQNKSARLWEALTGKPLGPSLDHASRVIGVTYGPASRTVLTAEESGAVRLWDGVTGKPIGPPFQHPGGLLAVRFSADGRAVLTAGKDQTVRLWQVPVSLPGEPERLVRWIEALTGTYLDESGAAQMLDQAAWEQRRAEFEGVDGIPGP